MEDQSELAIAKETIRALLAHLAGERSDIFENVPLNRANEHIKELEAERDEWKRIAGEHVDEAERVGYFDALMADRAFKRWRQIRDAHKLRGDTYRARALALRQQAIAWRGIAGDHLASWAGMRQRAERAEAQLAKMTETANNAARELWETEQKNACLADECEGWILQVKEAKARIGI